MKFQESNRQNVNWSFKKIKDIGRVITGKTPPTKTSIYWKNEIPFITPGDIQDTKYIKTTMRKVSRKGAEYLGFILPKNSISVVCIGSIGKIGLIYEKSVTNQQINSIICNEDICPSFLYYSLLEKSKWLISISGSNVLPILKKSLFENFRIPLPPLPEQKKIAEILSTVDLAIENVDRGIIKIEKIKKVLTYKLFTYGLRNKGTKTLKIGKIPKDWKISSLSEIAKVRYGLGQPPLKKDKGIPMIRATNIKEGKIFFKDLLFIDPKDIPDSRNPYLKENDIIVVRSGAYTGDVAYIPKEWEGSVAGYDLIITPSENINPKYLSLFLLSYKIQKRYFGTLKERSAQPHLNSHQLEMTPIVYPTLVEQKQVAEIISAIEQKQELHEKRKLGLFQLKKGLMNDLLTGRKRVRLES